MLTYYFLVELKITISFSAFRKGILYRFESFPSIFSQMNATFKPLRNRFVVFQHQSIANIWRIPTYSTDWYIFLEKHLLLTVIEFPVLCKTETHENAMFKFGKESVLDSKVESPSKLNHSEWFSSWSFSLLLWESRKVKGILTCCQSSQQLRTFQNTNE